MQILLTNSEFQQMVTGVSQWWLDYAYMEPRRKGNLRMLFSPLNTFAQCGASSGMSALRTHSYKLKRKAYLSNRDSSPDEDSNVDPDEG
jgi:hypothetical protein